MSATDRLVAEHFVQALAARDPEATAQLYASDARFEVHVPDWDTSVEGPAAIIELLESFFLSREDFQITAHQLILEGQTAALSWNLRWHEDAGATTCLCFQSHFFTVAANQIQVHRMYCAGVRVFASAAAPATDAAPAI